MKTLFVTVGSTKHDALIEAICSPKFVSASIKSGLHRWIVQYGRSSPARLRTIDSRILIESFDFLPCLDHILTNADIVISHAGTGTILDSLRGPIFKSVDIQRPRELIIVPNASLMENHQVELCLELSKLNICVYNEPDDLHLAIGKPDREHSTLQNCDCTHIERLIK